MRSLRPALALLALGLASFGPVPEARMSIARLQYGGGGDWYANPSSLPNLLKAIGQRTTLKVEPTEARVTLTDDRLWDYPFLHATGHGEMKLTDDEVTRLRDYLLRGGFLHVDDNYGLDESFRREIALLFPDRPLVELPPDHPVFHVFYELPEGLPKVHEHDGGAPQAFGIFHEGRLAVLYSYESDLGDGWEDPDVHGDSPAVRETALRMGVNLFVYALSRTAR
jgi:hypothetical protein